MTKVDKKVSEKDLNSWLDFKQVDESKRDKANVELLTDAISSGVLVVREDFHLVQKLKFEIGDEIKIKELIYKPRLKMSDIKPYTRQVSASDTFGLLTAYVCALTGHPSKVIDELDTEDNRIAQAISTYFL